MKLKRLYFVWVCKHVESFQWFVDLLHSTHTEVRFLSDFQLITLLL